MEMTVTEFIITIVSASIGSGGITGIIISCLNRKWSKEDKADDKYTAMMKVQKVLIIDKIRSLAKEYINRGCITLEEKEDIREMYDAYRGLVGKEHDKLIISMSEVESLKVNSEECP